MTDLTVGPDYNSDHETLADAEGRPITADYLEQLSGEAEVGYDLPHAANSIPTNSPPCVPAAAPLPTPPRDSPAPSPCG